LEENKKNPRKTWMLIDVVSSRKCGRARNISEIKVNIEPITSAVERTEVLNDYFATIGSNLASEMQPLDVAHSLYKWAWLGTSIIYI